MKRAFHSHASSYHPRVTGTGFKRTLMIQFIHSSGMTASKKDLQSHLFCEIFGSAIDVTQESRQAHKNFNRIAFTYQTSEIIQTPLYQTILHLSPSIQDLYFELNSLYRREDISSTAFLDELLL